MAKKSSAKHNFIASVLALTLSATAMVGTSFAWFSDTVTSKGNVIKTGTLEVEMTWALPVSEEEAVVWNSAEEAIFTEAEKWEPNYTAVRFVKIENVGNLALNYYLNVEVEGETGMLAEVIDVYSQIDYQGGYTKAEAAAIVSEENQVGSFKEFAAAEAVSGALEQGESTVVALAFRLSPTVDDEYQGQSIGDSFEFRLIATQSTSESDSFDNTYDENAVYGTVLEVSGEDDLLNVLKNAEADKPLYLTLMDDVTYQTNSHNGADDITPASAVVIDGQGKYSLTATGSGVTPIGDTETVLTLKNLTVIDKSVSYDEDAWEFGYLELGGKGIVCENVKFTDPIMVEGNGGVFKNCSFVGRTDAGVHSNGGSYENFKMYGVWLISGNASFESCTFTGTRGLKICDSNVSNSYATENVDVTVDGCTFDSLSEKPGVAIDYSQDEEITFAVTIKNSMFINCQAGDQGLYIYETDNYEPILENNTVYKNAMFISTAEELAALGGTTNSGDKTFVLNNSIDMSGYEMQPIGVGYGEFVFEGNGFTISNLKLAASYIYSLPSAGLFCMTADASLTVNNLTIDTVTVVNELTESQNTTSGHSVAVVVGYMGAENCTLVLKDVDIVKATIENVYGNAAICVGYSVGKVDMYGCDIAVSCTANGEKTEKTGAYIATSSTANCVVTIEECKNDSEIANHGRVLSDATVTIK
ncbi:MAG: right-handed parallel beta-helix repeat-containing protein [Clostridia bacterium]|nr:right-handed parallel beta-helix repeat-containing protein [Clostridia bacterium]